MSSIIDEKSLNDEQYLVYRIKESSLKSSYESKAWVLTARTLFPQNFDIQFEAYLIEKRNGNAEEAARFFNSLFQSFVSENGLWEEILSLTNALRTDNPTPDEEFLRKMFSFTPPAIQHDILTVTAEKSEDTMEHCRLMLLLFKKFPQSSPQLLFRLVDTLATAEKHGHCPNVLNSYRKTLVCEVLPLILNATTEISSKQLYKFVHKSIEFYLAFLMAKPSTIDNFLELEQKNDISWDSFFTLLKMFGAKLEWELCSIFSSPWNRDVAWQHILSVQSSSDPGRTVRQIVYCLTVLFTYSLHQYNTTLHPVSGNHSSAVLVEAFTCKESEDVPVVPLKKAKLDPCTVDMSLPFLSSGEGIGDMTKHFHYTYKCWNMLHDNDLYQKEFIKIKQHIRLDLWLSDFITDVNLYINRIDEFEVNIHSGLNDLRNLLQKLSLNYVKKNYKMISEIAAPIIKLLDSLPVSGNYSRSLVERHIGRHLHFLPIAKLPILQYVVKLLTVMYWYLLPNTPSMDVDRIYGCLLILCQMNWTFEKSIVYKIINRIRARRSFSFPMFFKYVVNVEILEEFMHMYSNEPDVKLDLIHSNHSHSSKRMSTRGANKEEREDFRHMMKQQVCRQEPLHTLIIQFLMEEESNRV